MKISFKIIAIIFLIGLFGFFNFSNSKVRAADSAEDLQSKIEKAEKAAIEAKKQLDSASLLLNKNQVKLTVTKNLLEKTSDEILRKEAEAKNLEARIKLGRKILSEYILQDYYSKEDSLMIELLIGDEQLGTIFSKLNQFLGVKDKILDSLEEIRNSKEELEKVKIDLEEEKDDHEKLLSLQQVEQQDLKEDVQAASATLAQLKAKVEKMRSDYTRILGKAVSTKDIVEAASFASKATGMNKSFLLGVLVQESNKGQSTGSCNYKESKMVSGQLTAFKSICKELKYDYTKQKVSCPPKNYKGSGGAMGVPQFMPTTWQEWSSRIASATGHKTPDPWNLVDGVTAMALKLSADGADSKKRFDEAKAYCVYLAGKNWGYYCFGSASKYKNSYENVNCWGTSIKNYGEKVLCLKDNYEKYY